MLDDLEDYEEVIEGLSRFLDSHSTSSPAFNNRGVAYWEIGQLEDALKDFDRAVLANPVDPIPFVNKGDLLKQLDQYQQAVESYTQAIEIKGDASFYRCRARTYIEMNLPQKAVEDFDVAIRMEPKHEQTRVDRAKAFESSQQQNVNHP